MKLAAKIALIAVILLGALDLAWVYGSRSYLNSPAFFHKISNETLQFQAEDVVAPWPGYVRAKNFRFHGLAKPVDIQVEAQSVSFHINLLDLLRHHVTIVGLTGDHMRLVITMPEDGKPAVRKEKTKDEGQGAEANHSSEKKDSTKWTTAFYGTEFRNFDEVRIASWQWTGRSDWQADFTVDSAGELHMENAAIKAQDLNVRHGDDAFAALHAADIKAAIAPFNVKDDWRAILPKVTTSWTFEGRLNDLNSLSGFWAKLDWFSLSGPDLAIQGQVEVKQGSWEKGSHLDLKVPKMKLALLHQVITGPAELRWKVDERSAAELTFAKFELNGGRDAQGEGVRFGFSTPDRAILQDWQDWDAHIVMPKSEVKRLQFLQAFIPASVPLKLEKGEGTLSVDLEASSHEERSKGALEIATKNVETLYRQDLRFVGDVNTKIALHRLDLKKGQFALDDATLAIPRLSFPGQDRWQGELRVDKGRLRYEKPNFFKGDVHLSGSDLSPVLAILIKEKNYPEWIVKQINVKNPKVDFQLEATEDNLKVDTFEATGGKVKISGWYQRQGETNKGKFTLGFAGFTHAIEIH